MRREELDTALDWARAEGWNVGLRDADCFYAADQAGFLLGTVADEPVGCISAVSYGDKFGFVGLFIVKPEWRGKGFGKQLWKAAMERLDGRVLALDAVTAREKMYGRMGFHAAHRSTCGAIKSRQPEGIAQEVQRLSHLPFQRVCESDRRFFPARREAFLDALVRTPGTHGFAYVSDGELRGWGVIRECGNGWKTGPLYADSGEVAEHLFDALQGSVPEGTPIFVNVPQCNNLAVEFAKRHGIQPSFDTVRMYYGPEPRIDKDGIYSLASFELG